MRCVTYCTAENYRLKEIADYFKKSSYQTKFYRDVLYAFNAEQNEEIFFFNLGSFVAWNLKSHQERNLIKVLHNFSTEPLKTIEIDHFIFQYGDTTKLESHDRFNVDAITLEDTDVQIKLAVSYGLAQSVKLESYEESILQTIKKNSSLPKELAARGRISLNGRAISRRMGEIFLERSSVNLSSEYLDMPEYFWRYPSLEDYYLMTETFLDISNRVDSLNQRLDVLHELFNMLTSQLQHRHSAILETIIIILILVEVIISLSQFHL